MTEERLRKFENVVAKRQLDLTVVLENVWDPHNISAVLRTCDAVGIAEIYVLYESDRREPLSLGHKSSAGARKWVDVHVFQDRAACFKLVKSKYDKLFATHLSEDAQSIYDTNLEDSVALIFGNERDGVSEATLAYADGNLLIPQMGMVQSLNISVACAVSLMECARQRILAGKYKSQELKGERATLLKEYIERHHSGFNDGKIIMH